VVNVLRIKRRSSGGAGAPPALANAELAYNEVDDILWYGKGGTPTAAASIVSVGGSGAFARTSDLASYQPLDADLTAIAALTGINVIYYRNAANSWAAVTIGTGLSFSGGTLSATGGGGTGNVSSSGTPTNGQIAQWTDATHIQGVAPSSFGFAPLANPIFTGDPQAPTPVTSDNDTSIATTAFVKAQGYLISTDLSPYAPLASPIFTGDPRAPTPATSDNDTSIATTAFVKAQGYEISINKGVANGYASLDATAKVPAAQLPSYVDDVVEYANLAAFPATGSTGIIYVALDTNKIYRWSGSVYVEISPSPGSTDAVPEGSVNLYYTEARVSANATVVSKAPLASPVFTGDPRAPTPTTSDNDTSVATTAFVKAQGYLVSTDLSSYALLASPTFTGDPKAPTPATSDNDTSIATTAFVKAQGYLVSTDLSSYAPLANPVFTGDPQAPTPATSDNDTSIATTAFVKAQGYITASALASYQPLDADLTALAGLAGTNTIYYRSATDTWSAVTIGTGLTFTGGTLAAGAAGSKSGAIAVPSANQTGIANETFTKVAFGTTTVNDGSLFNTTTSRWTPPVGKCFIAARAYFTGILLGTPISLAVYKNGVLAHQNLLASAADYGSGSIQYADNASGTDYYEIFASVMTSGTATITAASSQFMGFQI
jgi:hypothetical protein